MSSSGPDGERAWLQVGAGALKHCVASGCLPEATLLLEAIMARRCPTEYPSQLQVNTSLPLAVITLSGNRDRTVPVSSEFVQQADGLEKTTGRLPTLAQPNTYLGGRCTTMRRADQLTQRAEPAPAGSYPLGGHEVGDPRGPTANTSEPTRLRCRL